MTWVMFNNGLFTFCFLCINLDVLCTNSWSIWPRIIEVGWKNVLQRQSCLSIYSSIYHFRYQYIYHSFVSINGGFYKLFWINHFMLINLCIPKLNFSLGYIFVILLFFIKFASPKQSYVWTVLLIKVWYWFIIIG